MCLVTIQNVLDKCKSEDLIVISPVYRISGNRQKFKIMSPIKIKLSNYEVISIPKGFVTDLSSVPNYLWWAFSPYGNFLLAAIIHDYLYVNNLFNRKFADKEMLLWSSVLNPKNKVDNYIRYAAVRIFGKSWWRK